MLVSKPVPVAGEWYPPDGVTILEFWYDFQAFPVGGVIKGWSKHETNNYNISPGVLM